MLNHCESKTSEKTLGYVLAGRDENNVGCNFNEHNAIKGLYCRVHVHAMAVSQERYNWTTNRK